MWRYAFMLVASLFVFSATTLAEEGKPTFKRADQNDNGKVSIQEAREAGIPEPEARANDLDNDGKLARTDWKFVDIKDADEYVPGPA